MKHALPLLVALCAYQSSIVFAQSDFPSATITVRVLDEGGTPVVGASASAGFEVPKTSGLGTEAKGESILTDPRGIATFQGQTNNGFVFYGARAAGYYPTTGLNFMFQQRLGSKWLPDTPVVDVVLKRKINPIAMFARRATAEIPVVDVPVGFDLMSGDWVKPHGGGKSTDLICQITRTYVSRRDHDVSLRVTFPNEKDGILPIPGTKSPHPGSELRLPRTAPEDGYVNKLIKTLRRRPSGPTQSDAQADINYFFRVRTALDREGRIISALYGKIHGDIRIDPITSKTCLVICEYYLNPTFNDRNVEWDPKRNLAKINGRERAPFAP